MNSISKLVLSKKGTVLTVVFGAVTAVISLIMNVVLIPKIEASTNGVRCFDMNFGYSYETARQFLASVGETGKELYLTVQLPLDFIYPVAYTLFFVFLIIKLTKRLNAILFVPLLLAVFDYAENICTIIILKSAELSETLASLGSAFTSVKTILMYSVFLIIIICIVYYFKKKKSCG